MKLRNNLAGVLLMCQCACAHTYFAWNKPLPVEQTEVYLVPPPWAFGLVRISLLEIGLRQLL